MIVIQFDRSYFHWALLFVQSLAFHDPRHRIFADTVNLDNRQVAQLRRSHPRLEIVVQTMAEGPGLRATMANRKARVLRDAMRRFPNEPVFGLFDVDFLVRRPLIDLWARLESRPTALFVTNGRWRGRFYQHLQVASGIVLLRRDGAELAETWAHLTETTRPVGPIAPGAWFWDQATLARAWQYCGLPHSVLPMQLFANAQLDRNAAIWSAHVLNKDDFHARFRAEFRRQSDERSVEDVPPEIGGTRLTERSLA